VATKKLTPPLSAKITGSPKNQKEEMRQLNEKRSKNVSLEISKGERDRKTLAGKCNALYEIQRQEKKYRFYQKIRIVRLRCEWGEKT